MSYSRWTHSRWYTMWSAKTESKKRDNQIFEILDFGHGMMFTYKQLKDDLDSVLEEVVEHYDKPMPTKMLEDVVNGEPIFGKSEEKAQPTTEADMLELKAYMLRFIEDVEKDEELE